MNARSVFSEAKTTSTSFMIDCYLKTTFNSFWKQSDLVNTFSVAQCNFIMFIDRKARISGTDFMQ